MLHTVEAIYDPNKGAAQALLEALRNHPLTESARVSDADIEAQIQDISQSWEP